MIKILVILFLSIKPVLNCQGQGSGKPATEVPKFVKDHGSIKEYWTPTPEMQAKWQDWYANWYRQQQNYTNIEKNTKEWDYDDPGRPESWKGLKPGRHPQEPPPWAVIAEDSGKPHICFMRPIKGTCNENLLRWGYNPYFRQCVKFKYSGCGGNMNNFYNKRRCEQSCVFSGISNCLLYGRRVNC